VDVKDCIVHQKLLAHHPHTRQPSGNLLENQRATFPVPYSQSRLSVSSNLCISHLSNPLDGIDVVANGDLSTGIERMIADLMFGERSVNGILATSTETTIDPMPSPTPTA